jgi:hypothetical protein
VGNVNVSVVVYGPVRSDSFAPMLCLSPMVTWLALTGATHAGHGRYLFLSPPRPPPGM